MLRGVNKQIIEINETENKMFERAVLYVRPEYAELTETKLHSYANDFIKEISDNELWCVNEEGSRSKMVNKRGIRAIILSVAAALCIICAVIVTLLCTF